MTRKIGRVLNFATPWKNHSSHTYRHYRYQHEEEVDGLEALLVHLEMVSVLQMLADCDRSACLLCHQSATSEENEAFSVPELILQEASTSTPPHHSDPTTGSHKIGHLCIHCGKTLLGGLTSYKRHLVGAG